MKLRGDIATHTALIIDSALAATFVAAIELDARARVYNQFLRLVNSIGAPELQDLKEQINGARIIAELMANQIRKQRAEVIAERQPKAALLAAGIAAVQVVKPTNVHPILIALSSSTLSLTDSEETDLFYLKAQVIIANETATKVAITVAERARESSFLALR